MADPTKKEVRDYWETHPPGPWYTAKPKGGREYFDEITRHRYGHMYRYLPEAFELYRHPGERVLEVGCGIGTDGLEWARGGARYVGLDLTREAVGQARQRFGLYDQPQRFLQGDAENLPFRDASFDVVYSFGVLHHTPDTQRAIDEVHRVLRPGGRALIMLYHKHSYGYYFTFMFRQGILGLELLRHTMDEVLNRHAEYKDRAPIVRVYTRREARALFRRFARVELSLGAARGPGGISERLPLPVFDWLARHAGFCLTIKATK
jgi:ubiquinone/menaquinone biosynthesis C-methylase UbiE